MRPTYVPTGQNLSPHYASHTPKSSNSYAQPRMSHNPTYTNTSNDFSVRKEQLKEQKYSNSHSPNYIHQNKKTDKYSPYKPELPSKQTLSPIDSKTPPMKNSMVVGEWKLQSNQKYPKIQIKQPSQNVQEKPKRIPRMSQVSYPDMKISNFLPNEKGNKIPSFLENRKSEQLQINKKIPYPSQSIQRPQSSKQLINRVQLNTQTSLSSSSELVKKVEQDPTTEWVKKSWSKKKQKKFTINDFQQMKELGAGKYGHVYLVRQKKTNCVYALKIIQKNLLKQQEITEQFIRELKIQTFLNHPNIIKMYGFFDDNINIYILLQAANGGQLYKQLKKHTCMPEYKVATILRQICQAINQLHSNRIIHRDIKPQNIVLHDNIIKLCDFGWSVHMDERMRTTFCGTPLYVCPQILKRKDYNEKIDIWSLGVMMYEMIVGQNPFKITKEEQLVKIVRDQMIIPAYVEISQEGKNFLESCLQKNPQNRPNIRQLLNHDFFKKYPEKQKKMGM